MSSPKENKSVKKSDLLKQWRNRKKGENVSNTILPRPEDQPNLPSSGQQRLWLLQQMYPENPFYQYGHLYKLKGELDIANLTKSFQQLIEKHEILRSNFDENDEGVFVKINPAPTFHIKIIDCSDEGSSQAQKALKIAQKEATQIFDLSQDLLLRVSLIKLSEQNHWMVLSMHHIIGDRSSLILMNTELFEHYKKLSTGESVEVSKLLLQYSDFAYWKNQQKIEEKHLNFWLDTLSGTLPILDLPQDFPRPKSNSFRGKTISKKLPKDLSEKIRSFAKHHRTTNYVVLMTVFKVLLHRFSNQNQIIIGSPFSTRDKRELENLIGFFNETLVLKTDFQDDISFEKCIEKTKQITLQAIENKNVPFDVLVKKLNPQRHGSTNPIFQAMMVYNNVDSSTYPELNLEVEEEMLDLGVSKFDLTFFATDHLDGVEIAFEFALDLFETETMERMLHHFEVLIDSAIAAPQQYISKLKLLDPSDEKLILEEWNDTQQGIPEGAAIHHWIEKMASDFPEKMAVVDPSNNITYQQLNAKANAIAQSLISNGVQANELVGLMGNRSVEFIIGMLGILKAGAAYLPLDPEYPNTRLQFMLEDAGAKIILCQKALFEVLSFTDALVLEIEKEVKDHFLKKIDLPKVESDQLAYIIYTSGSTGQPKGVPITHHNLRFSTGARFHFFDQQPKAFLLLSSFSFDSSVAGIFWTLCTGGTLVLPERRIEQDIRELTRVILENDVTHTLLLPSLYALLLEFGKPKELKSLESVMVAGEACPSSVVLQHFQQLPKVELVNEYGPTEGTVWCTAHKITPQDAFGNVPIGRPIPNVQNYILDKNRQAVPIGVVGELFIGGEGIAQGYWNREELTAERFVDDVFGKKSNKKLYKTGDTVRYRKDGTIDFLGRVDHQVKIRGHRIELDEIKKVLENIEGIRAAEMVVQNEKGIPRLIAYLAQVNKQEVQYRNLIKAQLPDYMIPAAFVPLLEFPKLPNGKVDFAKLPDPDKNAFADAQNFVAPRNDLEEKLVHIWEQVLKLKPIGIHDNFFEIGGDSIRSIQVIAKAQQAGIELAPHQLFEYQTIEDLSFFLEKAKDENAQNGERQSEWSSIVSLNNEGEKAPLFCIHSGGGHVFFYQPLSQYLKSERPVFALQPAGLDGKKARHSSIEEMAEFYISEMKKVQPAGPYHILGTCFSNAVGLEMANQLKAGGEAIESLIFVDSGPRYLLGAELRGGKKTASRFAKMVKEGNWKGIQKKLYNRWFRTKQKILAPLENEQEKNLRLTITSLNEMYNQYTWKPYDGSITFIRSTEFAQRKDKDIHISQWEKLAKGGLEVHVVEGHHTTLFAEPEVKGLAEKIKACMLTTSL